MAAVAAKMMILIPAGTTPTKHAMIPASPLPAQPADWRRQYRDAVTCPRELLAPLGLSRLAAQVPADAAGFPLRVPRAFAARMRHGDAAAPLLRQVLPLDAETRPVA